MHVRVAHPASSTPRARRQEHPLRVRAVGPRARCRACANLHLPARIVYHHRRIARVALHNHLHRDIVLRLCR